MSDEDRRQHVDTVRPVMLRYLDGDLSQDDAAELSESLRHRADLRREFAELLYEHALLAELSKEKEWAPSGSVARIPFLGRLVSVRFWLAAAVALAVLAGWLLLRGSYPPPEITGSARVLDGGTVQRGVLLAAEGTPGGLVLGGYCRVEMAPGTRLQIEGSERSEQVYLTAGKVVCDVDAGKGGLTIRTDLGTVHVSGTRFSVELLAEQGGREMMTKGKAIAVAMAVTVMAGSVEVDFDGGRELLVAGATRVFAAGKGRIEAGKPSYQMHGEEGEWKGRGRIVGMVRKGPRFEITVTDAFGRAAKEVESESLEDGKKAYEVWLAPGRYNVRIDAKGYKPLDLKNLQVKSGTDLRIDLEFSGR